MNLGQFKEVKSLRKGIEKEMRGRMSEKAQVILLAEKVENDKEKTFWQINKVVEGRTTFSIRVKGEKQLVNQLKKIARR